MKTVIVSLLVICGGLLSACGSSDTGTTSGAGGGGTGVIGTACKVTSDCETGFFCSTDDPGGQCLKTCTSASECPSGSTCTDEGKCYASCKEAKDCTRSGYTCVDSTTITKGKALTCDVEWKPGTEAIGTQCNVTADCKTGLFCSTDDPNGQCLSTCKTTSDCPSGSVCTDEAKCYVSCTQSSDCPRFGYDCIDAKAITTEKTVKTCDVPD